MKECTPKVETEAEGNLLVRSFLSSADRWTDADGNHKDMYEMPLSYLKNCLKNVENFHFYPNPMDQTFQAEVYKLRDEKKAELVDKIDLLEKHLNSGQYSGLPDSAKNALSLDAIEIQFYNRD